MRLANSEEGKRIIAQCAWISLNSTAEEMQLTENITQKFMEMTQDVKSFIVINTLGYLLDLALKGVIQHTKAMKEVTEKKQN